MIRTLLAIDKQGGGYYIASVQIYNFKMKARIATVQIDYLPAYYENESDHLLTPLKTPTGGLGTIEATIELTRWRSQLEEVYSDLYKRKLERIVTFCAQHNVDVIVFPEYSIPASCLKLLQKLSQEFQLSIIAGTHRVDKLSYYDSLSENESPVDVQLHGRAICPVFIRGRFDFIQKLTSSKFETKVGMEEDFTQARWNSIEFPGSEGILRGRILVCSDFLPESQDLLKNHLPGFTSAPFDITFVVSWTPSLGDLTTEAIKNAFQQRKTTVAFTNNAIRGGTKVFYDTRTPNKLNMEESDGSFGQLTMAGPVVKDCGLAEGTEGIVIVDLKRVSEHETVSACQFTVCPIIHCGGPKDEFIERWYKFLSEYNNQSTLDHKRETLRLYLESLINSLGTRNLLLLAKFYHLWSHLNDYRDDPALDLMVRSVCVIHEEAPHLDTWIYRASLATARKLRDIQAAATLQTPGIFSALNSAKVEELITHSRDEAVRRKVSPHVPDTEAVLESDDVYLSPEQILITSGTCFSEVSRERSSSKACINAARWILHLFRAMMLESGSASVEDILRVANQIRDMRRYPGVAIMDHLKDILSTGGNNDKSLMKRGMGYILEVIAKYEKAVQDLRRNVREGFSLEEGAGIIAYGYSETVLSLFQDFRERKWVEPPRIYVPECRNRRVTEEGLYYAQEISKLGFKTYYISDVSVARLMSLQQMNIKLLLMGFNVANREEGVVNTVGSLAMALLAKRFGVDVAFLGFSWDIWEGQQWNVEREHIVSRTKRGVWISNRRRRILDQYKIGYAETDLSSDLVPWDLVDCLITDLKIERSPFAPETI